MQVCISYFHSFRPRNKNDNVTVLKFYFGRHLGVIVDIDHIYGPVSVTDEEDGVVIWLQHLKEVNICPTVDKNKIPKLQHKINQNNASGSVRKPSKVHFM